MRIGFWHSNYGGSPLMGGLQRGFESLGHHVESSHHCGEYDFLIVWNQIAHNPEYVYPEWPQRMCPIAFIDGAEYGYHRRHPWVIKDYANAFSHGSIAHDTKSIEQQARLKRLIEGRSFPYFVREKSKFIEWPASYHGIDYPLYHLSADHTPPNREEYLSRTKPFWQSWGASHPWRWGITHALRDAGYECLVLEENGHPRLPQLTEYFPKMRSARACCSFDGYGSSSFRRTEVLCRTVLLQGPLTVDFPFPTVDGETCVDFGVESDGENFVSTDIVAKLERILADPEWAFGIYERGFDHVHNHLSERALAEYVLGVVERHDYSQVTPLDL